MIYQKFFLRFLSLSFLVLTLGCSKEGTQSSSNESGFPVYTAPIGDDLKTKLADATLYCGSGNCPDNVGMIGTVVAQDIEKGTKSIGQCTGFLVAKNIVVTNAHCVKGPPSTASDCSNLLTIKFLPSSAESTNTFSCKRLLRQSRGSGKVSEADYAYFEIEPSARNPVTVATAGIADQLPLELVKVDPLGLGGLGGDMLVTKCKSVQNTVLLSSYTSNWSETALGLGCEAVHGNSGSPVFNEQTNEVVGILQSQRDETFLPLLKKSLGSLASSFSTNLPPHFIFTNISCAPDVLTGNAENQTVCAEAQTAKNGLLTEQEKNQGANQELLGTKINAWIAHLPKLAVYNVDIYKDHLLATPLCIRPQSDWPQEVLQHGETTGFFSRKTNYKSILESGVTLSLSLKIDDQYRFDKKLTIEFLPVNYELEITVSGKNELHEVITQPLTGMLSSIRLPWPSVHWCSDMQLKAGNKLSAK